MVKIHKLHKIAGLSGGVFLFLLALSGFFLDHDYWNFLYKIQIKTTNPILLEKEKKVINSIAIDGKHIFIGTYRGIYEKQENEAQYKHTFKHLVTDIAFPFIATNDGIYHYSNGVYTPYLLGNKTITSLVLYKDTLLAVENKHTLIEINTTSQHITNSCVPHIQKEQLQEDITLSRFIRDLHYGRGLFDGYSLILNDYATLYLVFLVVSGYGIFYLIRKKHYPKTTRKFIKLHANIFVLFASFFLTILAISGIFLDHASSLRKMMKTTTINHSILPPVYNSLTHDIWSVDFDGKNYRIGNRFGIYKSQDLHQWKLESKGFAYSMSRIGEKLYIGGMGAENKILEKGNYQILKNTPHMFKDVYIQNKQSHYLSHSLDNSLLPNFQSVSLYTFLLAIHDGELFASWWIWINDYAAFMLLILIITGTLRFLKRKRVL